MPGETFRSLAIVGLGIAAGLLLWLAGLGTASMGVVAVVPLALFNRWFVASAVRRGGLDVTGGQVMMRVIIRTVLSIVALLIAYRFGLMAMLGALLGLNLEVLTYFGEVLFGRRRR